MIWYFTFYSVPLIIGAVALIIATFVILRRSRMLTHIYMAIVNVLIAIYAGSYGMELVQRSLEGMYFWKKMAYVGGVGSPVFLLLLVFAYGGSKKWLNKANHLILMAIPIMSIGLAWTNPWHGLIWNNPRMAQTGTLYVFDYDPGFWYWIAIIYACIMASLSVAYLLFSFPRQRGVFRKQVALFLVGISFPMLTFGFFLVFIATGWSLPRIEWHAYALIITGLVMTVSLLNYHIFQIMPVALDDLFKNIEDAIVVLDDQNRVIDTNPVATRIFNWDGMNVVGKSLLDLLSSSTLEALQPYLNDASHAHGEIVLGDYRLKVKTTPFSYRLEECQGCLIVMRNITHLNYSNKSIPPSSTVYDEFEANAIDKALHNKSNRLTMRQREILEKIIEGYTYKEIGELLFISERTVKYHMGQILQKLDLKNKHDLLLHFRKRQS